jgi:hypothetical protein
MRPTRLPSLTVGLLSLAAVAWLATPAQAQNDWQYPDPYFGILEIEKSHNGATARRYRAEVNPAPRSSRSAAPSAWQAPVGEPAGVATGTQAATATPVTPAPVTRNRWRNRWRRQ